jgi:hypothetical protein
MCYALLYFVYALALVFFFFLALIVLCFCANFTSFYMRYALYYCLFGRVKVRDTAPGAGCSWAVSPPGRVFHRPSAVVVFVSSAKNAQICAIYFFCFCAICPVFFYAQNASMFFCFCAPCTKENSING